MVFEVRLSMNNSNSIETAALLSAIWEDTHKDNLDLIEPFVSYIISSYFKTNDLIDVSLVTEKMRSDFGFSNTPEQVIEAILKRLCTKKYKEYTRSSKGKYYVRKDMSILKTKFETQYNAKKKSTNSLLEAFVKEYNSNANKRIDIEDARIALISFLDEKSYDILVQSPDVKNVTVSKDKIKFRLANYVISIISDADHPFYNDLMGIALGALFANLIYIETDVKEYKSKPLSDLSVYFDTTILLYLLGYKTPAQKNNTRCIVSMLKENGAKLYCYENNLNEVRSIMTAYKYNSSHNSNGLTLEHFDEMNISSSMVDQFIESLELKLSSEPLNITICRTFPYPEKDTSEIEYDQYEMIDEEGLINYLKENIAYRDEPVNNDVACISSICRERKGILSNRLERSECIWVTSNNKLASYVKSFFKYPKDKILPVVTLDELAREVWIKYGFRDRDIPKYRLYVNAQMALEPTKKIIEAFKNNVDLLVAEGKYEPSVAAVTRNNIALQKEIMVISEGDDSEVSLDLVDNVVGQYIDKITQGAHNKNIELEKENTQLKQHQEHKRVQYETAVKKYNESLDELYNDIRSKANKKSKNISKFLCAVIVFFVIIFDLAIFGLETFFTVYGVKNEKHFIIVFAIIFVVLTFIANIFGFKNCKQSVKDMFKDIETSINMKCFEKEKKKRKEEIERIKRLKPTI